jgi:hypothetical protein
MTEMISLMGGRVFTAFSGAAARILDEMRIVALANSAKGAMISRESIAQVLGIGRLHRLLDRLAEQDRDLAPLRERLISRFTGTAGLSALLIAAAPRLVARPIWCAALNAIRPVSIITTTDGHANPWVAGGSGDDRLHAFRADTGEVVFAGGAASDRIVGLGHFATILPAENTLYVAGDARVYAFRPSLH